MAVALVIMVIEFLAGHPSIANVMLFSSAFLADVVGAAHEIDGKGCLVSVQFWAFQSIGGSMGQPKNILYSYSDPLLPDELEMDPTGGLTFKKGDILTRRGKNWLVDAVHMDNEAAVPTLWINLVHAPVN